MTTAVQLAQSVAPGVSLGFKNRLINGAMMIDQRGSASSPVTTSGYSVDRWITFRDTDGSYSVGQSSTAPTGFTNSVVFTVTSADSSMAAGQYLSLCQRIEGYNVADFALGTASAQAFTISFWVRSSVTGTFSGAVGNGGSTRSYSFEYTVSAANTWEKKTVTIAGDTTGTWATNNTTGLYLCLGVALGSDWTLAAGSWATRSGGYFAMGTPNQTNLMATNGATFYITGVQLEVGTTATPFEFRDYGRELMMCQRYCYVNDDGYVMSGFNYSANYRGIFVMFPVVMRAQPTCTATYTGGSWSQYSISKFKFFAYANISYTDATGYQLTNLIASAEL